MKFRTQAKVDNALAVLRAFQKEADEIDSKWGDAHHTTSGGRTPNEERAWQYGTLRAAINSTLRSAIIDLERVAEYALPEDVMEVHERITEESQDLDDIFPQAADLIDR